MNKKKTYTTPDTTVLEMESELLQSTSGYRVDNKKEGNVEEDWTGDWGEND